MGRYNFTKIEQAFPKRKEPDILECEVKWALGNITMNKASGCDGVQLSCFKS